MKKLLCMILSLTLCMVLAGCGRESAESVVEKAIQAVQEADASAMQPYWGNTDLSSSEGDEESQQMLEQIAKGLTYEITGSEEDPKAGTATVTVAFTNTDMSAVMGEWMGKLVSQALGYAFLPADQQPSDEEMGEIAMDSLLEIMDSHAGDTVTKTVDVSLNLVDDQWQIDPSDEVINALTGGMMDSFNALDEAFS